MPNLTFPRASRRSWAWLLVLVAIAAIGWLRTQAPPPVLDNPAMVHTDNQTVLTAFAKQQSKVLVSGSGTVIKTLPDDNKGSRHQRFILKLDPTHTVLVAHNIDLAPRLAGLKKGDSVSFYGEYVYNEQGGIIHWTHHDPAKRHPDGWLQYQGQRYQ